MNVTEIKKHVTHFSEELRNEAKHQQEVVVGGKITSIIPPLDDEHPMYIMLLDDYVGTIHAFVPEAIYNAHLEEFQLEKCVIVEGVINVLTRQIKNETLQEISVFAYSLKDTSENGDANL